MIIIGGCYCQQIISFEIHTIFHYPPCLCITTPLCHTHSVLVILYIRFKYIRGHFGGSEANVNYLNNFGIVLGVLIVLGMLLVGSFQVSWYIQQLARPISIKFSHWQDFSIYFANEYQYSSLSIVRASRLESFLIIDSQDDKVLTVHFIGAFMVFGFGILYEWVQLRVSFKIFRTNLARHIGKCILILRLVFCLIGTICFLVGKQESYNMAAYVGTERPVGHTCPTNMPRQSTISKALQLTTHVYINQMKNVS